MRRPPPNGPSTLSVGGDGHHDHRLTTEYMAATPSTRTEQPLTLVTFSQNGWSLWTETLRHFAPTQPVTLAEIHTQLQRPDKHDRLRPQPGISELLGAGPRTLRAS